MHTAPLAAVQHLLLWGPVNPAEVRGLAKTATLQPLGDYSSDRAHSRNLWPHPCHLPKPTSTISLSLPKQCQVGRGPCRGLQCEEGQGEQQASRPAGEEVGDQEGQLGRSWQTLQLPEPEWLPFPELDGLPLASAPFSAPHIPNGSLLCFPRPILLQGLFRGEQSSSQPPFLQKAPRSEVIPYGSLGGSLGQDAKHKAGTPAHAAPWDAALLCHTGFLHPRRSGLAQDPAGT